MEKEPHFMIQSAEIKVIWNMKWGFGKFKIKHCEKATKFEKSPPCFDGYPVVSKQVEFFFCGLIKKPELYPLGYIFKIWLQIS